MKPMAVLEQCMDSNTEPCPVCAEGRLHALVGTHAVEYRGQKMELPLHYSLCDVCGCEQGSTGELRRNKRAMMDFRAVVDELAGNAGFAQPVRPDGSEDHVPDM